MTTNQKSIITKNQKKNVTIYNVTYEGQQVDLIITLRYDDQCGNGHNTFSITGSIYQAGKRSETALISCGCVHDAIKALAPKYKKYIMFHLMSSDEPMHYIANTIYHASRTDLKAARESAIAPTATLEQLQNEDWLLARLPALKEAFKQAMEELRFVY